MDHEGSKGGMGTHKDLEQGHRARSKGDEEGCRPKGPSKTLDDAIQGFLSTKTSLKEFTLTNYRRQLENQVTEVIPATTPLRELEWDNGGRKKVRALRTHIEDRGSYDQAFRVQKVLAQALDYAILQGWMRRNQNPATKQKGEESKHDPKHHPHIQWEQVPELLEAINLNRCSGCWYRALAK
jgi:integrase